MNLTFIPGAVGFGLKNEHAADIDVFGCNGGIIFTEQFLAGG